jgi:acyl transferase domain-containing protein
MISSVTGLPAAWQDIDSNYFAKNARQPVLLFEAIERTLTEGVDILVEVGANPVLLSALQQTADALGMPVTVIGTMSRGEDDRVGLVNAAVELSRLTGGRADRRLRRRSERNGSLWPGRGDDGQ